MHSRSSAWARLAQEAGIDLDTYPFQRGSRGQINLPSDYGARYLKHVEFFSCWRSATRWSTLGRQMTTTGLDSIDWKSLGFLMTF